MARVAILGAGAIGGLAGAFMAKAGEPVLFIDQNLAHVEAIRTSGIVIDGCRGDITIPPQRAVTPEELNEPIEMLFLATKAQHTEAALKAVLPWLGPDSVVVSLQNGMNEPRIVALVGAERTMGALPDYGGAYLNPGRYEFVHEGPAYVGELDGSVTPRAQEAQRLLSHLTRAELTDNIVGRLWAKQVYTSQIVLSALVNAPIGEVLGQDRIKRLAGAVVGEALTVADAAGAIIPDGDFFDPSLYRFRTPEDTQRMFRKLDEALAILAKHQEEQERLGTHKYVKRASGIHWDIVHRNRKSEVSHLTGALLEDAERLGVETPLNAALAKMIYEIEAGERQLGWANYDELEALAKRLGKELP